MFSITHINKSIVTTPPIRINDTIEGDSSPDNRLQRGFGAVWNDFRINFSVVFEDAENNGFTGSPSALFSFNPPGTEKAFIDFDFSRKRRLRFAKFSDAFTDRSKIMIDRIAVKSNKLSNLRGIQIHGKIAYNLPEFVL